MPNESKTCIKPQKFAPEGAACLSLFLTARLQQAHTENDEILGRSLNQERKFKKYIYLIKSAVNDSPFTKKNSATISVFD